MLDKKNLLFDYNNSLVSLSNSILAFYGYPTYHNTLKQLDDILTKNIKHIAIILIDGMGSYNIEKFFKDSFLAKNKLGNFSSVYPPTTAAATTALLSGKYPLETGWFGWQMYYPEVNDNVVLFQNISFYDELTTYPNFIDKKIKYTSIFQKINNTKTAIFFPDFKENGSKSIEELMEKTAHFINNNDLSLTYSYWDKFDSLMHDNGIDSEIVKNEFNHIDLAIKEFTNNIPPNTVTIVVADHGHVNINNINMQLDNELLGYFYQMPSLEGRTANLYVLEDYSNEFENYFNKTYGDSFYLLKTEEFLKLGFFGKTTKPHPTYKNLGNYVALAYKNECFNFMPQYSKFKGHHAGYTKEELTIPLIVIKK